MSSRGGLGYDKQDIERAAYSMIANHGTAAAAIARQRAERLASPESMEAQMIWVRIVAAIGEIERRLSAAPPPSMSCEAGGLRG